MAAAISRVAVLLVAGMQEILGSCEVTIGLLFKKNATSQGSVVTCHLACVEEGLPCFSAGFAGLEAWDGSTAKSIVYSHISEQFSVLRNLKQEQYVVNRQLRTVSKYIYEYKVSYTSFRKCKNFGPASQKPNKVAASLLVAITNDSFRFGLPPNVCSSDNICYSS